MYNPNLNDNRVCKSKIQTIVVTPTWCNYTDAIHNSVKDLIHLNLAARLNPIRTVEDQLEAQFRV